MIVYMIFSNNSYSNTGLSMIMKTWWATRSSTDISTTLGITYTPSGVTLSAITSYYNFSTLNGTLSEESRVADDANGSLKYTFKVTYSASYNTLLPSNLNITFI